MIDEADVFLVAAMQGRLAFLQTGTGTCELELYENPKPASPSDTPSGPVIVRIPLENTVGTIVGTTLVLDPAGPGLVLVNGVPTWGRVVNRAGVAAFIGDAGGVSDPVEFRLSSTLLFAGGEVSLVSGVFG